MTKKFGKNISVKQVKHLLKGIGQSSPGKLPTRKIARRKFPPRIIDPLDR